jgi:peptidoglycan/xylan/chitin deacetylase (PgdA/CDA1 family)
MRAVLRSAAAVPLLAASVLTDAFAASRTGAFRILLFHDIAKEQCRTFETVVRRLARAGRLMGPAEVPERLAGADVAAGTAAVLSFDDGFASNFEIASSILREYGVKALFFVCPGLINSPMDRQRDAIAAHIFSGRSSAADLPGHLRLMNWDQLERLKRDGHVIGSHTLHHCRLAAAEPGLVEDEIGGAAAELHKRLGESPAWCAYPFGDIGSINAAALRVVGRYHRFCRSGIRGPNGRRTHPLALFADHVDLESPALWRRVAVRGALDFRYAAARAQLMSYVSDIAPPTQAV